MARSPFNSPLVRIAWTDAVSGNKRSTFKREEPLELRFGLMFEPSFWTSFDTSSYFFLVTTYRFGNQVQRFQLDGDTRSLPGAPGAQLWVGMRFGRAAQATTAFSGSVTFRGEFWFARQGGVSEGLDQWAMAPNDHAFLLKLFDFDPADGTDSLSLTGGAGTPPGTPTS